jgi:hypothetical protein
VEEDDASEFSRALAFSRNLGDVLASNEPLKNVAVRKVIAQKVCVRRHCDPRRMVAHPDLHFFGRDTLLGSSDSDAAVGQGATQFKQAFGRMGAAGLKPDWK